MKSVSAPYLWLYIKYPNMRLGNFVEKAKLFIKDVWKLLPFCQVRHLLATWPKWRCSRGTPFSGTLA